MSEEMEMDKERAAFEAWYLGRFGNRAGSYDEAEKSYHSMNIQWRFEAWQARASQPAAVDRFSIKCSVCKSPSTLDERKELSGCCWSCGHEIDLDPYLRATLSAQLSAQTAADPWAASGVEYDRAIHHNPDAKAWADMFVATFPGQADKHDLMLGWFANAMMAMHDWLKSQEAQRDGVVGVPRELLERLVRATGTVYGMASGAKSVMAPEYAKTHDEGRALLSRNDGCGE